MHEDGEVIKKITDIINRTEIIRDSIGISTYESEEKDANIICAKSADELLTINNITASFVLGLRAGKVFISGRSIGDINVQIILEKLRRRRTYYACWSTVRRNNNGRSKRSL